MVENQVWAALLVKLEELRDTSFTQQTKQDATQNQIRMELVKVEEQIDRFLAAIAEGNAPASIMKRITDLEARQAELLTTLQKKPKPHPLTRMNFWQRCGKI